MAIYWRRERARHPEIDHDLSWAYEAIPTGIYCEDEKTRASRAMQDFR